MEILAAIEQLGFVRALKSSFFAYPIVNALHIMSIGALLTSVLLMDLRIVGFFGAMPRVPFVRLLRRTALAAFLGALITGSLLFSVRAREYAVMPVFLIKMALIVAAGANLLAFLHISRSEPAQKPVGTAVAALALLSLLLWICVLFAGRFIGFM